MKCVLHLLPLLMLTAATAADEGLLVRAGGAEITVEDVRASLETLDARQLTAVREDKTLLEQVVRSFIAQRLVLQQALERKWNEEPEVIARLKRAHDTALTQSFLESVAQPPAHYPDEEDLKAAYAKSQAALLVPRTYRLAQLFVPLEKDATPQAQQQAEEKIHAAAARMPADPKLVEIGWLSESQIQPEIRGRMPVLKPGAVSPPIRLDDGWHILKVLEMREAHTPTLDQVRSRLRAALRSERLRENTEAYLARLLKENPIVLDQTALARVLPGAAH
ncbi:peptidylprolyl isomerase [Prosthecobacter vanneervenii]|uniref:Parvulin-like peptidyl-prolyl isomerase n=1 Tax=Prosthecobacter vanneervenii TaxID=48466 RepID=A0A7W7YCS2_9BACT|nr:peptidyl-prolyl cis-trans isomerase [Prosthecobacter vanneervenii]MBB5033764.1 parvulin-like peptidyl-prolyl isomerase [Prosthecobacter vanneervenii]